MSANHYSQMLCQLSYGEGFLPSDAPIPAGHGPPLQVPDPQNPLPWAHVIPANPAPCPRPPRSRGCDPDARLPRRQGEASPSWRPDLGLSAHSAGTLLAPLTPPALRLLDNLGRTRRRPNRRRRAAPRTLAGHAKNAENLVRHDRAPFSQDTHRRCTRVLN